MENKIKAILATVLVFLVASGITYGITKNVQFIGILFISAFLFFLAVNIYKSFYDHFESKNNKNK